MFQLLLDFLVSILGGGPSSRIAFTLIVLIFILLISVIIKILLGLIIKTVKRKSKRHFIKKISSFVSRRKTEALLAIFSFFLLLSIVSENLFYIGRFSSVIGMFGMVITVTIAICSILDVIGDYYHTKEISKSKPIKGFLQVIKVALSLLMSLILISYILGQSPLVLISGFGAFAAILAIVFKDPLQGLVAGIQISSENLLEIGDYILFPSLEVEGTVVDISLMSVKVKSYDNTIISIPAYSFMSLHFKNLRTTVLEHKKQISFVISVDPHSVKDSNLTNYRDTLIQTYKSTKHIISDSPIYVLTDGDKGALGLSLEIRVMTDLIDFDKYTNLKLELVSKAYELMKDSGLTPLRFHQ